MNLQPYYTKQKELQDFVVKNKGLENENLLPDKVIALQVEFNEMLQEWRGFKYWSEDQKPRTKKMVDGDILKGVYKYANPLLEEYVDALHFLLEFGIDFNKTDYQPKEVQSYDIKVLIIGIQNMIPTLASNMDIYQDLMDNFLELGKRLGFTDEQIEQAYDEKYQVNVERQRVGY